MNFVSAFEGMAITQAKHNVPEGGREVGNQGGGAGDGPSTTFRTSFKTAIANRKSAMLLLSQVLCMITSLGHLPEQPRSMFKFSC